MWIKTLRLEGFQSHKDTVLTLHPHFNCIIGTGNSGKSALVRALSFVLFGHWESSWVRNGSSSCRITITTDSGLIVTREKGAKVNRYLLEAPGQPQQVYENFGTQVPDEIEKSLHIFKAKVGDKEELNLNLSNQLDQLFLLSNPGSYKAKVLGKLSKAHYLDHALREFNRDKKQINLEKVTLEKETPLLEADLAKLDYLDASVQALDAIGEQIKQLERRQETINKLKGLLAKTTIWKESYIRELAADETLQYITITNVDNLIILYEKLKQIRILSDRIGQTDSTRIAMTKLVSEIETTKALLVEKYSTVLKDNKKCPTCLTDIDNDLCKKIVETL